MAATNHPLSLHSLLKSLWSHVGHKRKIQFFWLILLMVLASMAEALSLGALMPFLGVIASPEGLFNQENSQYLINLMGIKSPAELLVPVTTFFCIAVLLSGITRLLLLWTTTKLSYALGADLSMEVYRRTLYQNYQVHISQNSSELIAGISTKISSVILHIINPILIIISSVIILFAILFLLISINPKVSLISFFGFGLIYLIIIKFSRARLIKNAIRISNDTNQVVKAIQESLGGIRDVLIGGAQNLYCEIYHRADTELRKAQGSNYFIGNSPRFIVEASGMILIAIIALNLMRHDTSSGKTIITLGIFALGAQRLLPVLQQMFYSVTSIRGNEETLRDVIGLLDQPLPPSHLSDRNSMVRMPFKRQIELQKIYFRYDQFEPFALNDINILIKKGSRVGIIGSTGSGKSTLVDLVMALLIPTTGTFKVDGIEISRGNYESWQLNIAHVPQAIYLMDSSVAENIAFGEPSQSIDISRVKDAAKRAQIADTIESWKLKYDTIVGENGIKLSGGQRQRIAIARALYKSAELIVLDEATSALDEITEGTLMNAMDGLSSELTFLIIAHRVTTLKNCDLIIELCNGSIARYGTYEEIVRGNV